jgi:hypothetical protein
MDVLKHGFKIIITIFDQHHDCKLFQMFLVSTFYFIWKEQHVLKYVKPLNYILYPYILLTDLILINFDNIHNPASGNIKFMMMVTFGLYWKSTNMKSYRKAPKNLFLKQQGVPKRTFLDIKNVIEIKSYILKLMKVTIIS